MIQIKPAEASEITKLVCPHCGEKFPRVGLRKGSRIVGLTFRCRKCGSLWEVTTE